MTPKDTKCPKCGTEMEQKGTVRDEDLCGNGCCRDTTCLYRCPSCKNVELKP